MCLTLRGRQTRPKSTQLNFRNSCGCCCQGSLSGRRSTVEKLVSVPVQTTCQQQVCNCEQVVRLLATGLAGSYSSELICHTLFALNINQTSKTITKKHKRRNYSSWCFAMSPVQGNFTGHLSYEASHSENVKPAMPLLPKSDIRPSEAVSAGQEVSASRSAAVSASRNAGACSQFQSIKCENLTRSLLVVRDSALVHSEGEIQSHTAAVVVVSGLHLTVITQFHGGSSNISPLLIDGK